METNRQKTLEDIANKLRIDCINATNAANSGHPTSCASIAEIIAVLFFDKMKFRLCSPLHKSSDRFVLSKGHAAPILYAAWAERGLFPVHQLQELRKLTSVFEGHPTPRLDCIDVATGSLGQGLSIGCGMAYVGKYLDKASYRVYVLIGDGESAEGSIWEALNFASYYKLDNLCVIFDINRLGQSEPTCLQHQMDVYRMRVESFGANAIVVDGHDVEELSKAFDEAVAKKEKPTAILAKTFKGRGFTGIEDMENWHGKPIGDKGKEIIEHLEQLIDKKGPYAPLTRHFFPDDTPEVDLRNIQLQNALNYEIGTEVSTRSAYGDALCSIAKSHPRIVAFDADTKNSTFSEKIKNADPNRFVECFIAEQNLVGVAIGAACRDRCVTFASTFAAFFSRAFDQIRMGAISQTNANFVGSHCGVSIGEDGPSQMGLEDLALFRSIPGCTIFYPSDAVSCARAVELAANTKGICYIRTTRLPTPVIYNKEDSFQIGRAHVIKSSNRDRVLVIGAGVTLFAALIAAEKLEPIGGVRVLDPFTIKPIDGEVIIENAKDCGGRIIVVEDHYVEGGLGEAVAGVCSMEPDIVIERLAVNEVPRSGPARQLLQNYAIDSGAIVGAMIQQEGVFQESDALSLLQIYHNLIARPERY